MVKHAIILAGGKGERLRPLTDKVPKPMVNILGRPLVEYQLLLLVDQGIEHIVFSCGYKAEVMKEYFGDGSRWGIGIDYAIEEEPLGRGGAFKNALKFIPQDVDLIYASNGDEVIAESLEPMIELHKKMGAMATIFTVQLVSPFGIVEIDETNRVKGFREKPVLPHWVSAGVYILNRSCIELFPNVGDHEDHVFPDLAAQGKIYAYKGKYWGTVNTIKELNKLVSELPGVFPEDLLKKFPVSPNFNENN